MLALVSIAALLPQVLVSPFAGSLVDRWNRRKVMAVADSITACSIGVLAYIYLLGVVEIWQILMIMITGAIADSFHFPAMASTTTLMVPRKHLGRVGGMNQALSGIAGIMAPPLGALLLAFLPMASILAIDVVTASIAVAIVLSLSIPQPVQSAQTRSAGVLSNMVDGFRYIVGWRPIAVIVFMAMIVNLLTAPAFSLLPILVSGHFMGDAAAYAVLQSVLSVGLVLGGLLLGAWGGGRRRMVSGLLALVMAGIGMLAIGLVPSNGFLLALLLFFLVGFAIPIMNGSMSAVLQSAVPPDIQGRVFSILTSLSGAMIPVGLSVAGPLADLYGVPAWFLAAGLTTIVMSIAALSVRSVRDVEETERAAESRPAGPDIQEVADAL